MRRETLDIATESGAKSTDGYFFVASMPGWSSGLGLFIHKQDAHNELTKYAASEASTGRKLCSGRTIQGALDNATGMLYRIGETESLRVISSQVVINPITI